MKEETVELYMAGLNSAFAMIERVVAQLAENAGVKTPEERRLFEFGRNLVPRPTINGSDGLPLRTSSGEVDWKKLKKALSKAPEPSREQREAHIKSLNSVPGLLRRAFAKTAKSLPHGAGGHPFALKDSEQRLAICKLIAAYRIDDSMDTAKAIAKVAANLNRHQRIVSTKTLRRYFDKYIKEQAVFVPEDNGSLKEGKEKSKKENKA